jgi:hypothetical protein
MVVPASTTVMVSGQPRQVRWTSLGEEGAQQGSVEVLERAGQGGLAVLGAAGR